jgi:hypothetical protein
MPYTPAHNLPDPDFAPESSPPGRELAIEAEVGSRDGGVGKAITGSR